MEVGFQKNFYFSLMIIQNHNKCLIKIIHFLLVVLGMVKHFEEYSNWIKKNIRKFKNLIEIDRMMELS